MSVLPPDFAAARLVLDEHGTPYSESYGDVYHSAAGGQAQTRHVFLAGNGLPERWRGKPRFTILELGFGLGLNFLTTWQAWQEDSRRCAELRYIALEKHPFTAADLGHAHAAWAGLAAFSKDLLAGWPAPAPGRYRLNPAPGVVVELFVGDARGVLPGLPADLKADALFLDGFAPDRNPELWSPEVFGELRRRCAPGATLATWSVAGRVRRALVAAGFSVERRPGFAGKRQMLAGALAVPVGAIAG